MTIYVCFLRSLMRLSIFAIFSGSSDTVRAEFGPLADSPTGCVGMGALVYFVFIGVLATAARFAVVSMPNSSRICVMTFSSSSILSTSAKSL